jgi:hypothetical protein
MCASSERRAGTCSSTTSARERLHDLVAGGEQAIGAAVEVACPQLEAVGDADGARRDPDLRPTLADRALDDVVDAERQPELARIDAVAARRAHRRQRPHPQRARHRQRIDDLLAEAVGDLGELAARAQRQDRDRARLLHRHRRRERRRAGGEIVHARERRLERARIGEPICRFAREAAQHDVGEHIGDAPYVARIGRRFAQAGERDRERIVTGERPAPRQELEQDRAERVDVGRGRDLAALDLLGRHVRRRADEPVAGDSGALAEARDPEVGDRDTPGLADEDVVGLEVAVQHAAGVRRRHARGDRAHDPQRLGERRRSVGDELRERLPVDVLHRQEVIVAVLAEVERPHDIAVRHAARELYLGAEPLEHPGQIGELAAQQLQRYDLVELGVARAVHAPHAAGADQPEYLVAAGEQARGRARRGLRGRRRGDVVGHYADCNSASPCSIVLCPV